MAETNPTPGTPGAGTPVAGAPNAGAPNAGKMMSPSLCWACHHSVHAEHFCPECAKVQPLPTELNFYELLELPVRMDLDQTALETKYHELSRQLHPDYYQRNEDTERHLSLERFAAINQAYRALRTLPGRARYLLDLYRWREGRAGEGKHETPKSLLMTVFALQEAIEELGEVPNDAPAAQLEAARSRVREISEELDAKEAAWLANLRKVATQWDGLMDGGAEPEAFEPMLRAIEMLLNEKAYLDRLRINVAQALGEA